MSSGDSASSNNEDNNSNDKNDDEKNDKTSEDKSTRRGPARQVFLSQSQDYVTNIAFEQWMHNKHQDFTFKVWNII